MRHPLPTPNDESLVLDTPADLARLRRAVREVCLEVGMSGLQTTRLITAAVEIARNVLRYAERGGATVRSTGEPPGVCIRITDRGAGIADLERAFTPGFSSGTGLGLGLSGARRLADEFELDTSTDGTSIRMVVWR